MSYIRADQILPKELLEAIQQYVDGKTIYIPRKEKQEWGSGTAATAFYRERNQKIREEYLKGVDVKTLARRFSLSGKSIERILRERKAAVSADGNV